jgi:hypothetical protein
MNWRRASVSGKKDEEVSPVDVKSSVPIEVKLTPESSEQLGGNVAKAVEPVPEMLVTQNPNQPPMPVIIQSKATPPPRPDVVKGEGATLAPTTTEAEDKVSEGQRAINRIWEETQSRIALVVVVGGMFVNALLVISIVLLNKEVNVTQLALISICLQFINLTAGIVIGFYFSRTNHEKTGGTGSKPEAPYSGR